MDAIKILGSLLGNNALGSSVGSKILGSLLGGGGGGGGADILGALLGGGRRSSGGGLGALGGILDAASRGQAGGGPGGGMDILGGLLGGAIGGGGQPSGGAGGLGGILGSVLGGASPPPPQPAPSSGGGLGGLLGGILGGKKTQAPAAGGGMGDLIGGILGGAGAATAGAKGSDLLAGILGGGATEAPPEPPKEAQDEAELLIRAMLNAAKADGKIDDSEKEAILGRLGDLDAEEVAFIQSELEKPLDLEGFVNDVPDEMDHQIYSFSLMAVKLDSQNEAQYFASLAQGLGLDGDTCNQIHAQLGQPEIFA